MQVAGLDNSHPAEGAAEAGQMQILLGNFDPFRMLTFWTNRPGRAETECAESNTLEVAPPFCKFFISYEIRLSNGKSR